MGSFVIVRDEIEIGMKYGNINVYYEYSRFFGNSYKIKRHAYDNGRHLYQLEHKGFPKWFDETMLIESYS